ncbi:MAG: OmpA family protein [Myxococcales bacterium]|nr:OmpA family protein [Myxococcales bacterium]
MKRRLWVLPLAVVIFLLALPALALAGLPKPNINTQLYKPSLNGKGLVTNESGDILRHLKWTVSLHFNWASQPVRVEDALNGDRWLVSDRLSADLGFALGLFDWVELGLNVPTTLYQNGFTIQTPQERIRKSWLLGDVTFYAKVRILQPEKFRDMGLNFKLGASFPTADPRTAIGDPNVTITPTLNFSYDGVLYASVNIGGIFRLSANSQPNLSYTHDFYANLGLGYTFRKPGLTLFGELTAMTPFSRFFQRLDQSPIETGLGVIWKSSFGLHVLGGASVGVGSSLGGPIPRVFVGVRYTNEVGDRDGDGVADRRDRCPDTPGPIANRGCPWGDKDKDGVLDNEDRCPDQPGPRANHGCPWGDKDKDGVLDNEDKCPDQPGPRANHGCPWGDRDGDGVPDNLDKCPNVKGPPSNHGCPVAKLAGLTRRIFFKTGSHELLKASLPVIAEIAKLLKEHPEIRVRIEGHTSKVSSAKVNMALSKARAKTVYDRLVQVHGISASRLIHEGYGFERPLVKGNTPSAHAKNRRVEMIVIEK